MARICSHAKSGICERCEKPLAVALRRSFRWNAATATWSYVPVMRVEYKAVVDDSVM